jgi:DNA-binding NarL/FixJ family response regulator
MALRILIADDSKLVRDGIRNLLSRNSKEWLVCGEASDGHETLQSVAELKPDVVLLDLSIPKLSGVEVAKFLQQDFPAVQVILVSQQEERLLRNLADSAGVRLCISKSQLAASLPGILLSIHPQSTE